MAISGQVMILFLVMHVIGNSTIYFDGLNSYAEKLHSLPFIVWIFRSGMLLAFALHVFYGVQLTLENRAANPEQYAVRKNLRATFASKNMIWSGLLIGVFLLYHLLHFTVQVTNPEISAQMMTDSMGRPDVAGMVILSFQQSLIAFTYIAAMVALLFHLIHGIQSSFQTLGLNNESISPVISRSGSAAAVILFTGYILIPVIILLGMLKG